MDSGVRPSTVLRAPVRRDRHGIVEAMDGRRAAFTPAQLVNRLVPTTWVYESLWRVRSLSLLADRAFPVSEEFAELDEAVAIAPGSVVADVACSEGLYGRHLAAQGAEVLLIDHSKAFLRKALRRCAAEGIIEHVDAVQALAQRLPIEDACVDSVVMGGSLNEIGDGAAAMREMVRVLRPGGRLFCMSLVPASSPAGRLGQALARPGGIRFPSAGETVAMLGSSMRLVEERLDGVVLRLTAEKSHP